MGDRDRAYREAGVNIQAGNSLVERIKGMVAETFTHGVLADIGGFGGLFRLDLSAVKEPVLVAATDGVGTKLKLAFEFNRHGTVGIDLVAMSVNDVLVQGAKPLFFLDYFATGKLAPEQAAEVVSGVASGCKEAECALLGGETAEMPGFYAAGEYDLAGFCVGMADRSRIVDGTSILPGDVVVGVASSGLHSNGYSLVRKILAESRLQPEDPFPGGEGSVADVLLAPTRIYVRPILNCIRDFAVHGMAHITGGGLYDNLPRILSEKLAFEIQFGSWDIPPVFTWLKMGGGLLWPEMLQIFNCGLGYCCVVRAEQAGELIERLAAFHLEAWEVGKVVFRGDAEEEQVRIVF